jgi:hypothetical protein
VAKNAFKLHNEGKCPSIDYLLTHKAKSTEIALVADTYAEHVVVHPWR